MQQRTVHLAEKTLRTPPEIAVLYYAFDLLYLTIKIFANFH